MDLTKNKKDTKNSNKRGPKFNHKGTNRKLKAKADKEIVCLIERNPRTGKEINSNSNSFSNHQIIELKSAIQFEVINIQRQITTGEDGKTVTAPNPPWIKNNKLFGPKFEAFIVTLRFRYNMPWNKIKELIQTFSNEKISSGLLANVFQDVKNILRKIMIMFVKLLDMVKLLVQMKLVNISKGKKAGLGSLGQKMLLIIQ